MIRVLRLIEYTYDTTERMVQDRWRWTVQHTSSGIQMRSVELPPTLFDSETVISSAATT